MTIWYLNAEGDDANDGLTPATPKRNWSTVSGAASNYDTIYITGRFLEGQWTTTKTLKLNALGYAEMDGSNLVTYLWSRMGGTSIIDGMVFRRAQDYAVTLNYATTTWRNCVFADSPIGVQNTVGSYFPKFENCLFLNCGIGFRKDSNAYERFTNCAFIENDIGILMEGGSPYYSDEIRNCVFRNAINIQADVDAFHNSHTQPTFSDENVYDFSYGKNVYLGVDKTSLADWQTALGDERDSNSHDRDLSVDLGDPSKTNGYSNPASWLLTGSLDGDAIGIERPAVTLSNNRNSLLWTAGVFSNTEIDGNGDLVLSAGQTTGTWQSGIIDFGANIAARSVHLYAENEDYPNEYVEASVRVRGSATAFLKTDDEVTGPTWVSVPREAYIGDYMSNALRYWQIELTLQGV